MQEMLAKFIEYKLDKLKKKIIESNFLMEFCIETIFMQLNFKDFQAKLEYLKNVQAVTFSKVHIVINFHPSHHLPSSLPNGFLSFFESCFPK